MEKLNHLWQKRGKTFSCFVKETQHLLIFSEAVLCWRLIQCFSRPTDTLENAQEAKCVSEREA